MSDIALQFALASNFVLNGCIAALDSWVVKVLNPQLMMVLMTHHLLIVVKDFML